MASLWAGLKRRLGYGEPTNIESQYANLVIDGVPFHELEEHVRFIEQDLNDREANPNRMMTAAEFQQQQTLDEQYRIVLDAYTKAQREIARLHRAEILSRVNQLHGLPSDSSESASDPNLAEEDEEEREALEMGQEPAADSETIVRLSPQQAGALVDVIASESFSSTTSPTASAVTSSRVSPTEILARQLPSPPTTTLPTIHNITPPRSLLAMHPLHAVINTAHPRSEDIVREAWMREQDIAPNARVNRDEYARWQMQTLSRCIAQDQSNRNIVRAPNDVCNQRLYMTDYIRSRIRERRADADIDLLVTHPYRVYGEGNIVTRPDIDQSRAIQIAELMGASRRPLPNVRPYVFAWTVADAIYAWLRAEAINVTWPMAVTINKLAIQDSGGTRPYTYNIMGPGEFEEWFVSLVNDYLVGTVEPVVLDVNNTRHFINTPLGAPFASLYDMLVQDAQEDPEERPEDAEQKGDFTVDEGRVQDIVVTDGQGQQHTYPTFAGVDPQAWRADELDYLSMYALVMADLLQFLPSNIPDQLPLDVDQSEQPDEYESLLDDLRDHNIRGYIMPDGGVRMSTMLAENETQDATLVDSSHGVNAVVGIEAWQAAMPRFFMWNSEWSIAGMYQQADNLARLRDAWYIPEAPPCNYTLAMATLHLDVLNEMSQLLGEPIIMNAAQVGSFVQRRITGNYADFIRNIERLNPQEVGFVQLFNMWQAMQVDLHMIYAGVPRWHVPATTRNILIQTSGELLSILTGGELQTDDNDAARIEYALDHVTPLLANVSHNPDDPWNGSNDIFLPPTIEVWSNGYSGAARIQTVRDAVTILSYLTTRSPRQTSAATSAISQ